MSSVPIIISPEFDQLVINEFPFPIAWKYQQIPPEEGAQKAKSTYHALTVGVRYVSLILISQYTVKDLNDKKVRDYELTKRLYENLAGKMSDGAWNAISFDILGHYARIYQEDNRKRLFVPEFYDIPRKQRGRLREDIQKVISMRNTISEHGNPPKDAAGWREYTAESTEMLTRVLESFSFLKDYDLIRIVGRQGEEYSYRRWMGAERDKKGYKFRSNRSLDVGPFYLARKNYADFLYLHPLLVFWDLTDDVLMYDHAEEKKAHYLPNVTAGRIDTSNYLAAIRSLYEGLEKAIRPKSEDLTWEQIKEVAEDVSNTRILEEFRKVPYLPRSDMVEVFHEFLASDKTCLVISGDAGSGKTSFLCNLYEEFRENPNVCVLIYPGRKLTEQGLEGQLRVNFPDTNNEPPKPVLARMNQSDIIRAKKLIVCVDAINEHEAPKKLLKSLDQTVEKYRFPWFKLLITCRTNVMM